MIDIYLLIGIIGAVLIVVVFLLNQIKVIDRDDLSYDLSNFIGAVLLIIYAWSLRSYPFIVINIVWAGISLRDVIKKKK